MDAYETRRQNMVEIVQAILDGGYHVKRCEKLLDELQGDFFQAHDRLNIKGSLITYAKVYPYQLDTHATLENFEIELIDVVANDLFLSFFNEDTGL